MEAIGTCLSVIPVPGLNIVFNLFRSIWTSVQDSKASRARLEVLATCIAQLLNELDRKFVRRQLSEQTCAGPLSVLTTVLQETSTFVEKHSKYGFMKCFILADQRNLAIEGFHRRITACISAFQISALIDISAWQQRRDGSLRQDQLMLRNELNELLANQRRFTAVLDVRQDNVITIMCALEKKLKASTQRGPEQEFMETSLKMLRTWSGSQATVEEWTITPFEVELSSIIGSGGFGMVKKGVWNQVTVAVKLFKTEGVPLPNSNDVIREIKILSKLRHPNIVVFLGANVFDGDPGPFVVMPYYANGNARTYVRDNPDCLRLKIVHDACLGMLYLHTCKVIHGDIKGMNILIDDSGRGLLCDFGLSRFKTDATTRTALHTADHQVVMGSRNWMSPERLLGGALRRPVDVYAMGMTMYEVFTSEAPLGQVLPGDFLQVVARDQQRPEKPDEEEAPQMTDPIWRLIEQCWAHDPLERPNASVLCEAVKQLLDQPTPEVASYGGSSSPDEVDTAATAGHSFDWPREAGNTGPVTLHEPIPVHPPTQLMEYPRLPSPIDLPAPIAPPHVNQYPSPRLPPSGLLVASPSGSDRIETTPRARTIHLPPQSPPASISSPTMDTRPPLAGPRSRPLPRTPQRAPQTISTATPPQQIERQPPSHSPQQESNPDEELARIVAVMESLQVGSSKGKGKGRAVDSYPLPPEFEKPPTPPLISPTASAPPFGQSLMVEHAILVASCLQEKDYDNALIVCRELHASRLQRVGASNLLTLLAARDLAWCYYGLGQRERASGILEDTSQIEIDKVVNGLWVLPHLEAEVRNLVDQKGVKHVETLEAASYLALVYLAQNKINEALPLARRAVEVYEEVFGMDHVSTLSKVTLLAQLFRTNKLHRDADALFLRAISGYERKCGRDHFITLSVVMELAKGYRETGRHQEADVLFTRCLDGYAKELGPNHAMTLGAVYFLALSYFNQKLYEEAIPSFRRCFPHIERTLGFLHEGTVDAACMLAECYQRTGRNDNALAVCQRTLREYDMVKTSPLDSSSMLGLLETMGDILGKLRRNEEALEIHQRLLEGVEKSLGCGNQTTLDVAWYIVIDFLELGQHSEAADLFERLLAGTESLHGPDHPSTFAVVHRLGFLYHIIGKNPESEILLERALEGRRRHHGPDHQATVNTMYELAKAKRALGKFGESEALYQRVIELKGLPKEDDEIRKIQDELQEVVEEHKSRPVWSIFG